MGIAENTSQWPVVDFYAVQRCVLLSALSSVAGWTIAIDQQALSPKQ